MSLYPSAKKTRAAVAVHNDVLGKVVREVEAHRKALAVLGEIAARPSIWGRLRWLITGK